MDNWKAETKVFSKQNKYSFATEKQSTKMCPICGNKMLLLTSSLNLKTCTDCGIDISWYLEKDQQPLL